MFEGVKSQIIVPKFQGWISSETLPTQGSARLRNGFAFACLSSTLG